MKIKRLLFAVLILAIVICWVPVTARAEETASGTCGDNLTWTLDADGLLTISGTGAMDDYSGLSSAPWTSYQNDIITIVIEEGVASVGDYAFTMLPLLENITISETVTSIGQCAIIYCDSLENLYIPETVESIGDRALMCNRSLASIQVAENNQYFINDAYGYLYTKDMTVLISATCGYSGTYQIPEGVETVEAYAFSMVTGATEVQIPSTVTEVGELAFGADDLKAIWVDANNEAFSSDECGALLNKAQTTLIRLPAAYAGNYKVSTTVNLIAQAACLGCDGLTEVVIPASVADVGVMAFCNCSELGKITFEGDVPEFGMYAFYGVTATAYYPTGNATWTETVMRDYGGTITWVPVNSPGSIVPAKPYKIANVVSGVHVYWKVVDGAAKYGLWRSETGKDGTYKWVANPTVPHFTDTKVESGKTYYYKVTAVSADGVHSEKSDAIGVTYLSTPDITSRFNKAAGITLGWNKIEGATGYRVYRKSYTGNDAWIKVGEVSGNGTLTWTDTSVKNNNGTVYKYTVRALYNGTLSGCRSAGRTMARLSSRVLNSAAKNGANAVKCAWTTSAAVTGYEVRFMVGDTVYKTFTVGNCKTGVKTFSGLPSGQTYKIQVRAYLKIDGMGFYSAWSTAKNVTL